MSSISWIQKSLFLYSIHRFSIDLVFGYDACLLNPVPKTLEVCYNFILNYLFILWQSGLSSALRILISYKAGLPSFVLLKTNNL